jgi:hypothetical protein
MSSFAFAMTVESCPTFDGAVILDVTLAKAGNEDAPKIGLGLKCYGHLPPDYNTDAARGCYVKPEIMPLLPSVTDFQSTGPFSVSAHARFDCRWNAEMWCQLCIEVDYHALPVTAKLTPVDSRFPYLPKTLTPEIKAKLPHLFHMARNVRLEPMFLECALDSFAEAETMAETHDRLETPATGRGRRITELAMAKNRLTKTTHEASTKRKLLRAAMTDAVTAEAELMVATKYRLQMDATIHEVSAADDVDDTKQRETRAADVAKKKEAFAAAQGTMFAVMNNSINAEAGLLLAKDAMRTLGERRGKGSGEEGTGSSSGGEKGTGSSNGGEKGTGSSSSSAVNMEVPKRAKGVDNH